MPTDRRRRGGSLTDRASDYFVNRSSLGRRLAAIAGELRQRRVPLHWTTMFGVVSMACVVVLFATGVFLMFLYTPSGTPVVYRGGYVPLHGTTMSKALSSTLAISFAVQGGLVLRQAHHWAALLLPVSLILQLLVSFFTGAFRTPRKTAWVLLFLILIVALVGGWSGYALPDDMLSGTGLRIVQGIVVGIPVVGSWASALLFGGGFPGQIIEHLYPIHIVIVPVLLVLFLAARIRSGYVTRPTQLSGPGRTEDNVVGVPLLPTAATRAGGLLLTVMGLIFFVSATFTVSPVWLYGPSSPADASADSQPDWYTGFLDGALRLIPSGWGFVWLGHTWALAILIPLAVVGAFLLAVLAYPFVEQWITGDRREHNLLDRPRNTPTRTAIGVAGMTFYGALWGAGSADLIATHFQVTLESVLLFYQVAALAGPITAFVVTRRICFALQRRDHEVLLHGYETGRIVRMPGGGYVEVHRELDAFERWRLVNTSENSPIRVTPDARGRIGVAIRIRARLSEFFFEERIAPVAKSAAAISDRTS